MLSSLSTLHSPIFLEDDAKGVPVYEDARKVQEQEEAAKAAAQREASGDGGQGDSADSKKKTESEVEKDSNNDTINLNRFHTTDDPMREVTGAGVDSDPKEIQLILNKLEEAGVEIRYHDSNMAYAPGLRAGVPGQFIIDKKASYSAWAHEYKHFCDDMADGFPGMRIFMDTEKCKQREIDAYNVEIELAKRSNREDIVERLEKLKALEVSRFDRYPEEY